VSTQPDTNGAGETIAMAVIGSSGHAARVVAPVIAATAGARLVGVLGSTPERGAALAGQYPDCRAYAGWDELAHDTTLDAAWVAGPNNRHVEFAGSCLKAG
jgi:predicted dehydrogenase